MKLSKDQLNSLIKECVEEKLEELGENFEASSAPQQDPMKENARRACTEALQSLKVAADSFRKIGVKATAIDDCYFTLKRFMEANKGSIY